MTDPEAEDPSDSHISDPQKIWIIDVCSFKVLNVWQFILPYDPGSLIYHLPSLTP